MAQSSVPLGNHYARCGALAISKFVISRPDLTPEPQTPLATCPTSVPGFHLGIPNFHTTAKPNFLQPNLFLSMPLPSHLVATPSFQRLPRPETSKSSWIPFSCTIRSSRKLLADSKTHPQSNLPSLAPWFQEGHTQDFPSYPGTKPQILTTASKAYPS